MAKLVALTEGLAGTVHELKSERVVVGRLEDNDLTIPEPSVSSHHCELLVQAGQIRVRDLGSTNGTFINEHPVSEADLKPGQVLRLGKVELRFDDGSGSPAAHPQAQALANTKRQAQQTIPIAGVKLGELDKAGRAVIASTFAKRDNKTNKLFLYGGLALGAVIITLIVYSIIGVQAR